MTAWFESLLVRLAEALAVRLFQFVASRKRTMEDAATPESIKRKWDEWIHERLRNRP
jgi:hypothetical protein